MIKINGGITSYWLLLFVSFMLFYFPMISLTNARKAARGSVAMSISRIRFLILWNVVSHLGVSSIGIAPNVRVPYP